MSVTLHLSTIEVRHLREALSLLCRNEEAYSCIHRARDITMGIDWKIRQNFDDEESYLRCVFYMLPKKELLKAGYFNYPIPEHYPIQSKEDI